MGLRYCEKAKNAVGVGQPKAMKSSRSRATTLSGASEEPSTWNEARKARVKKLEDQVKKLEAEKSHSLKITKEPLELEKQLTEKA